MTHTRWLDERESHAWRGYLNMHAQLTARLHRQLLRDSGLSLTDFDVLVQLTDRDEPQVRIGELAESLQWEQSRLSHHLARMQRRGLVRRESCPDDARGAYITLTEQGSDAIREAAPAHVETVRELLFDQLTDDEVGTLATIADRVLKRMPPST